MWHRYHSKGFFVHFSFLEIPNFICTHWRHKWVMYGKHSFFNIFFGLKPTNEIKKLSGEKYVTKWPLYKFFIFFLLISKLDLKTLFLDFYSDQYPMRTPLLNIRDLAIFQGKTGYFWIHGSTEQKQIELIKIKKKCF